MKKMLNIALLCAISFTTIPAQAAQADKAEVKQVECLLCFEDIDEQDMVVLSCNHTYCAQCLDKMVQLAIGEQTTAQLKCPNRECNESISPQDISTINKKTVKQETLFAKWFAKKKLEALADASARDWLSSQPHAIQCPTPSCSYVFLSGYDNYKKLKCPSCEHIYCSICRVEHDPGLVPCKTVYKEAKISAGEKEAQSEKWKQANTKKCPNCATSIEKNYGCLHMTCTQCKTQFCWECLGQYVGTQYFHPFCNQGGAAVQAEQDMNEQEEDDEHSDQIVPYLPIEIQEQEREQRAQMQEHDRLREAQREVREFREFRERATLAAQVQKRKRAQRDRESRERIQDIVTVCLMLPLTPILLPVSVIIAGCLYIAFSPMKDKAILASTVLVYLWYCGLFSQAEPECTLFGVYPVSCNVAGLPYN